MVASKLMLFLLVLFCNILVCLEATIYNPFFLYVFVSLFFCSIREYVVGMYSVVAI